ncbi:hypothetical protein D3C81_1318910 [compost metagenome]
MGQVQSGRRAGPLLRLDGFLVILGADGQLHVAGRQGEQGAIDDGPRFADLLRRMAVALEVDDPLQHVGVGRTDIIGVQRGRRRHAGQGRRLGRRIDLPGTDQVGAAPPVERALQAPIVVELIGQRRRHSGRGEAAGVLGRRRTPGLGIVEGDVVTQFRAYRTEVGVHDGDQAPAANARPLRRGHAATTGFTL